MNEEFTNSINNLISQKDFLKAKELLTEAQKENPEDFFIQKNLGFCNVNLNSFEEAKDHFEKAIIINNKDATSWYYLGILKENMQNTDEAENAYLKVVELRPTFSDAYKNLSIIYMKKKDFNKALLYAQKANEYNPEDYQPYYILSSILINQNRNEEVIEILKKGLKIKPDHSNMNANIGGAYFELKDYDKALYYLNKAIEYDSKNAIAYNILTNYYIEKEDFNNAYMTAKIVYEIEPSDIFLVTLAMCASKAERYDDAIKYYKSLSVIHPEKQSYQINLAQAYMGMEDYTSAENILYRLYQLNPKSESIGMKLVECYRYNGNFQQAAAILKNMISRGSISTEVRYNYAIISAILNDFDTALDELKKVVKLDANNAVARKDLAVIYLLQNQIDFAKEEFEKAYEISPNSYSIIFEYANFLNQIQNFEKANELYEKAIVISDKQDPDILLYAAINLISMNEIDKAYEYLMLSDEKLPHNFETLANLGKVLFFMGKFEDSKNFCEQALEIKKHSETQNVYGACLMALNKYEYALQIFLDLYETNPSNITIMISITKCYYNLNDFDNALTVANKILEILPECNEIQDIVKQIEEKKEKKNESDTE